MIISSVSSPDSLSITLFAEEAEENLPSLISFSWVKFYLLSTLKNFSRFSHSKSTECTISNNSLINF
jgi:hypothetical protein